MYYYGARYYDPKISLWLSVDPLAEKYPAMSPYIYTAYTANNPIRYIDPNGKQVDIIKNWMSDKKADYVVNLIERHKVNDSKIMAYSVAADVLIETTEYGEWVTRAREKIINVYGDDDMKKANRSI